MVNDQTTKLLNHDINEGQYTVLEEWNYKKSGGTQKPMWDGISTREFVHCLDVEWCSRIHRGIIL